MGMGTVRPRLGRGRFQWNTGGWFGAQLGSTAWLLVTAPTLFPERVEAGLVAVLCFLVPNVFGLLLYLGRSRLAPYPALQWLLLLTGLATITFVVYLNQSGLIEAVDPRLGYGEWGFALVPVLYGGLMIAFHVIERSAVRRNSETRESRV